MNQDIWIQINCPPRICFMSQITRSRVMFLLNSNGCSWANKKMWKWAWYSGTWYRDEEEFHPIQFKKAQRYTLWRWHNSHKLSCRKSHLTDREMNEHGLIYNLCGGSITISISRNSWWDIIYLLLEIKLTFLNPFSRVWVYAISYMIQILVDLISFLVLYHRHMRTYRMLCLTSSRKQLII